MREQATVVALEDDSVWVETQRQGSCQACAAKKGCGQGLMSQVMPGREHYIRALGEASQLQQLTVGDVVSIDVPDDVILKASAVIYLIPLLMLILGMFIGTAVLAGDPGAIVGGALGLACGAGLVRWHAYSVRNDERMQPRLVEMVRQHAVPLHDPA